MPAVTGQWQLLVNETAKVLQGAWKDLLKDSKYTQFMEVMNTKKWTEREQSIDNMQALDRLPEGAVFPEMLPSEGWAKAYTQQGWGGRVSITIPMRTFQTVDAFAILARQLKQAPTKTRETIGATYLEYGDTALSGVPVVAGAPLVDTIGGDGLTIFNTAHTFRQNPGGSTWSNLASSYVDLTEAGVIAVFDDIMGWKDNTNAPFNTKPNDIIYNTNKTAQYLKVKKSLLEPGSGQNAINVTNELFAGGGVWNPWLTSQNDWYATTDADPETYGLKFYMGIMDQTYKGYDQLTQNYFVALCWWGAHGANELRTIYGVKQ